MRVLLDVNVLIALLDMAEQMLDNEARFTILRRLAANPQVSQRDLARDLGISLGKANYCVRALLDKGHVKVVNFKNSHDKRAYLYKLAPAGIATKSRATVHFLARKQAEYERLAAGIAKSRRGSERGDGPATEPGCPDACC